MKQAGNESSKPSTSIPVPFFGHGIGGLSVLAVARDIPRESVLSAGHYVTIIAREFAREAAGREMEGKGNAPAEIEAIHMLLEIASALSEAGGSV